MPGWTIGQNVDDQGSNLNIDTYADTEDSIGGFLTLVDYDSARFVALPDPPPAIPPAFPIARCTYNSGYGALVVKNENADTPAFGTLSGVNGIAIPNPLKWCYLVYALSSLGAVKDFTTHTVGGSTAAWKAGQTPMISSFFLATNLDFLAINSATNGDKLVVIAFPCDQA